MQMVPYLYVPGQLPDGDVVSHLEVLAAYINVEALARACAAPDQLEQGPLDSLQLIRRLDKPPSTRPPCAAPPASGQVYERAADSRSGPAA
jgi:hypothetical protein